MAIRGILSWTNPTQNTDGTAYDAATENAGYDLAIDGTEATVSLPFAFGTTFDMNTLAVYQQLKSGNHTIRMRVVTKGGVSSDWTAPITFRIEGTPLAPTAVAVA